MQCGRVGGRRLSFEPCFTDVKQGFFVTSGAGLGAGVSLGAGSGVGFGVVFFG